MKKIQILALSLLLLLMGCGTDDSTVSSETSETPAETSEIPAETSEIPAEISETPYVAFEHIRRENPNHDFYINPYSSLFINIDKEDLKNQDVYIYIGSYEDNLEKIENEFKDPDFLLADVAKDSMNEINFNDIGNHDEYTIIATKFSSTDPYFEDFAGKSSIYAIPHFDIKELETKNLSYLFYQANEMSQDMSDWDVSNVENMESMFREANSFNSDLSNWDVSNVENMESMFYGAESFNSDLSNLDVSNVENMKLMFWGAKSFNSDLSNWDVSNVENMESMFAIAESFNSDLSAWDVSNVENMVEMFLLAESFNSDLSNWNVSNVENYYGFSHGNTFTGEQLPHFNR